MEIRPVVMSLVLAVLAAGCKHEAKPEPSPTPMAAPQAVDSPTPTPAAVTLGPLDAPATASHAFVAYEPGFTLAPDFDGWRGPGHDPTATGNDGQPMLATQHHPEIGPYSSSDDALLGYQLILMKGAGFDGAVVAWHGERTPSETATKALFEKAKAWDERYGLRFSLMVAIDESPYVPLPALARADALREDLDLLNRGYTTSSIYQRLEGKPVVFCFPRPDARLPNEPALSRGLIARGRTGPGRELRLAYRDAGPRWLGAVDLPFAWPAPTGNADDDGGGYLDWFYTSYATVKAGGSAVPLAVGVAYPGYEPVVGPDMARHIPRTVDGQATLARTWSHVFTYNEAHPDARIAWMQVASWNDWRAGSEIEPSVERGSSDYEQAAAQNGRFTGVHTDPATALTLARAYLAGRRAGQPEEAFSKALERFAAGEFDTVAKALPDKGASAP